IAAEAMGIDLFSHKVIIFTVSAIFAGIAGALYAHIYGYIDYTVFTSNLSFNCISIVVVGGLANFVGTIYGALFLTILPEMLRSVEFLFNYRMIVYGIILVLVMWMNHSIPGAKIKENFRKLAGKIFHRKSAEAVEEV
ncbi:MAG: branched-chain amino acid ABC transporter permease, partial [Erysipelotrichaceae bacterium]|nr:branched-chain amino acid ABC transporter permease [Erysipelotrichaceae bacterium]